MCPSLHTCQAQQDLPFALISTMQNISHVRLGKGSAQADCKVFSWDYWRRSHVWEIVSSYKKNIFSLKNKKLVRVINEAL